MRPASAITIWLTFAALCGSGVIAQDAPVKVVEVVEEEAVEVEEFLAMPADNHQLKVFAYATVQVALARRACDLTDEQEQVLAQIDDDWVRKISQEKGEANVQQPGLIALFFGARPAANNPQVVSEKIVRARIDKRIAELLTDEQKEAYQEEQAQRAKFRSEAVADALIESLQPRLGLTDKQREEIKTKVAPWASRMNLHTMYYFSGNNYFPNIPEHLLSKTLDEDQMAAYRGLQKHLFTDENFNDGQVPIVIKQ